MGYLEIYRIFVPELRRSLHIAKYRNEQKSARFHIVTYIIKANAQLLDFQSKSKLERVSIFDIFPPLYIFRNISYIFANLSLYKMTQCLQKMELFSAVSPKNVFFATIIE